MYLLSNLFVMAILSSLDRCSVQIFDYGNPRLAPPLTHD